MRSGPIPLKKADLFGKDHDYEKNTSIWGDACSCWGNAMGKQQQQFGIPHDLSTFSWDTVLAIRMVVTAAVFLLISGLRGEKLLEPVKKDFLRLLRFTVLGLYTMQVPFTIAIHYSNAATGTVLQYLMPVILLGYYLILERRRPRRREAVAAFLAIVGTFLIATKGEGAALAISREALFWGILSAFGMAFYTAFAADLLHRYPTFLIIGWGSLGNALLLMALNHPTLEGTLWTAGTLAAFGIIIVLGTLIAYTVYLESTKYIPASETGALAALNRCPLMRYPSSLWETAWVLWKWRVPCASWSWYGCFPKRLDQMNHHTTHHTNVQANCNIWNSRIFLGGELA